MSTTENSITAVQPAAAQTADAAVQANPWLPTPPSDTS